MEGSHCMASLYSLQPDVLLRLSTYSINEKGLVVRDMCSRRARKIPGKRRCSITRGGDRGEHDLHDGATSCCKMLRGRAHSAAFSSFAGHIHVELREDRFVVGAAYVFQDVVGDQLHLVLVFVHP